MLPEAIQIALRGIAQKQDALIAELYNGKISFGTYNVGMNRLTGQFTDLISALKLKSPTPESSQSTKNIRNQAAFPQKSDATNTIQAIERPHEKRLALVIGNSNYRALPRLPNPQNDARSIADALQKMGYQTDLLLDATEQSIRTKVRKFADDSRNAGVALVFYAGHGAQVNGSNYLLPVDMDIPQTEADIQLSALKVDDLINSVGSTTKIVFLDACRDNPALFSNFVKGRGASPGGLAPAASSNFNQSKPGGGIFIAYATDAGAVVDDGHGEHSPFTQALLRYMERPVSIDDMFSLVTREVRLVTKNIQRPYKYASLENIICLTNACSVGPTRRRRT